MNHRFFIFLLTLEKVLSKPNENRTGRMNSAGSDTDTMYTRNAATIGKTDRVELFSTDSEMDSFFRDNESIVNKNNEVLSSSDASANRTDENQTLNEDDDEFNRIVSEAQR